MTKHTEGKLNWLERHLPEGLLADAAWLQQNGYSTGLRSQYVSSGRLEQPTRGVYRRPRGSLSWQQVVISLQTLMRFPLVVGGRTSLELQGFAHYLSQRDTEVHLYGVKAPPNWLHKLPLDVRFRYHNSQRLFRSFAVPSDLGALGLDLDNKQTPSKDSTYDSLNVHRWGQWEWPVVLTTPERAFLELLDELPRDESFHQVDVLLDGLTNLSPRRLEALLIDCKSVKVKRLFFFFANRHGHAWLKRIDRDKIDFGKGKRMLVKGGKLDPLYLITVPEDLDGVR